MNELKKEFHFFLFSQKIYKYRPYVHVLFLLQQNVYVRLSNAFLCVY